ncbi:GNAT family N-acetyltransferase [Anaerolineales bacterium HSG6]|nr:GNAT family N-acetyltransferase [Anaerolineales bacterium HSG6]MDM8530788.1 GNAT family N-acetyltransferase [Anaerolineales bacterium HSG25]
MKTSIFTNVTTFDALSVEWDNLLERAVSAPFFMRYAYQRAWWQYLGNDDLVLIVVRDDDDRLVGLVPLYGKINQAGQRELSFVGCVEVSDYLDMLVDPNHAEAVYIALLDCFASTDLMWDRLYLCSLPHNSPTHARFAELVQQRGWRVAVSQQDVCPVITLADSWDNYLAGIVKKQRHEIRRKIRRLERDAQVEQVVIDSEVGLDAAMDIFIDLHQKSTPDKEDFWSDQLINFFKAFAHDAAQAGWLKLYFLEVDGAKLAAMLCFDYDNQFLLYNSGYDPAYAKLSVGNVLTSYTIKAAIELGRTRYDFLRGDETYKFRFGAESEVVYDLQITRGA